MKYLVKFTRTVEREVCCEVEADSEEQALEKAKIGEYENDDEQEAPEKSISVTDYKIYREEDETR